MIADSSAGSNSSGAPGLRRIVACGTPLRGESVTLRSANDCLIAACAIEADEPLLHADADFDRIASVEPRLRIV